MGEQRIRYHFLWAPMRCKPCLIGEAAQRLHDLILEKAAELSIDIEQLSVFPDRVYVAVTAPPTVAPHHIICQFKAHSSRCLRHEFQEMTRIPTLWTRSYLVQAGDSVSLDSMLTAFAAAQPPKRRPGRPRTCDSRDLKGNQTHNA